MYKFELRREHWQKNATDVKTNYDAEMLRGVPQMMQKSKNRRKQSFEDEGNSMRLDKEDTQRSTLNSEYLSALTLALKYPVFLFVFIVFDNLTRKVRFDIEVRSPRKRS